MALLANVRCKFRCQEVVKRLHWDGSGRFLYTAKFSIVISNSDENKVFFDATPSGEISIGTFKDDHFIVGQEYYVDFLPAEKTH